MEARRNGWCVLCREEFSAGAEIEWYLSDYDREVDDHFAGRWVHAECYEQAVMGG